jgi:6-phospho-beta-glucosidase
MKVTVVGGGSTYTPELVDGIARLGQLLAVDELVLTDPAEERLALVAGVSQRIFAKYGYPGLITYTADLDRAVADATVVLLQLRVGGQAARAVDERLPLQCG